MVPFVQVPAPFVVAIDLFPESIWADSRRLLEASAVVKRFAVSIPGSQNLKVTCRALSSPDRLEDNRRDAMVTTLQYWRNEYAPSGIRASTT